MGRIFKHRQPRTDHFGQVVMTDKDKDEFQHLIGQNVNEIILFENGTDELLEQGRVILPRYYHIFVGNKDGKPQFKPYEFDRYRIVVSTQRDIIINIESIG